MGQVWYSTGTAPVRPDCTTLGLGVEVGPVVAESPAKRRELPFEPCGLERVELEGVPAVAFAEHADTVVQAVGGRSDLVLGLREDSYELVVDGDELQPMSLCRRPGLHR